MGPRSDIDPIDGSIWYACSMRLEAIDLNLLLCLGHLLDEQSVSKAARKMGVTQPTMSHRLTQLRELFDDQLLVRAGRGMRRTPAADNVHPRVQAALAAARDVLVDPAGFDPSAASGKLHISALDYEATMLVQPLVQKLSHIAPRVDVRVTDAGPHSPADLGAGKVDLLVGPELDRTMAVPDNAHEGVAELVCRGVFRDRWCMVSRSGHPRGLGPITLEEISTIPHVLKAYQGGERSFFDNVLLDFDVRRRVAVTLSGFYPVARMVAATDFLAVLPLGLARTVSGLQLYEPPIDLPPIKLGLWWHPRSTRDPRHRWVRGLIREIGERVSVVD